MTFQVWSDYLRMRFHPKTNVILKEYQHENLTRYDEIVLYANKFKAFQIELKIPHLVHLMFLVWGLRLQSP